MDVKAAETDFTKEEKERVILLGVCVRNEAQTEESLEELRILSKTANAVCVAKMIQKREKIHPGTYIGKGKIEEVRDAVIELGADTVVCDDELSPAQHRNLEDALPCKVIDRTVMILDIFASHAHSREGMLQVELAQLKYRATRLKGIGTTMSRLGGGIGTRGPGEKKLETDRRLIRERAASLQDELKQMIRTRELARKQRKEKNLSVVSIVGYTNAGKSTLLNRLTDAGVLSEDKLFATLDPTTRVCVTESGQEILFTDTVGFIRKLPHHLIEAFKSTLEEAKHSDIILHVVDASSPDMETQMDVVYKTLSGLGISGQPVITVFNKIDKIEARADEKMHLLDERARARAFISAKRDMGIDELLNMIELILREQKLYIEREFSFNDAGLIQKIRKNGQLLSEEYTETGIMVRAYLPKELGYLLDKG